MKPIAYHDDIEFVPEGEQEAIDGIVAGMSEQTSTVEERQGHAVRASHAKSTACAVGTLTVADVLPPELAQGLFARPGRYPVAVRFAQGPGEILGDRVSTHRGMSIKVFDVEGERLPGHDATTQDFVLATGTTFPAGDAPGFLRQAKKIGAAVPRSETFKSAASSLARNFNKVLHTVGAASPTADFYGHPMGHPLAEPYFSQCPMRFGDYVAKLGSYPSERLKQDLGDWILEETSDENGFRRATVDYLRSNEVAFELRAQLLTNAETQPIEDTSVDWPVEDSPYRTVATLRLPAQDSYSDERARYFDEVMTFRPAHSLAAHRPLGSIMRARLQVYRALSDLRHRKNGIDAKNIDDVSLIPS